MPPLPSCRDRQLMVQEQQKSPDGESRRGSSSRDRRRPPREAVEPEGRSTRRRRRRKPSRSPRPLVGGRRVVTRRVTARAREGERRGSRVRRGIAFGGQCEQLVGGAPAVDARGRPPTGRPATSSRGRRRDCARGDRRTPRRSRRDLHRAADSRTQRPCAATTCRPRARRDRDDRARRAGRARAPRCRRTADRPVPPSITAMARRARAIRRPGPGSTRRGARRRSLQPCAGVAGRACDPPRAPPEC